MDGTVSPAEFFLRFAGIDRNFRLRASEPHKEGREWFAPQDIATRVQEKLPSEQEWPGLMRRALDGDQGAYGQVLRAMLPAIRAFIRRRVHDATLVEDVIQDTLLTIHKLRHTYDPARPMLPWIAAISSARAVDALRKSGRSWRNEVSDEVAMAAAIDTGAEAAIEAHHAERDVDRLLGVLPPRQRMILEMVKLREMTLEDAAKESRMTVSAVKAVLHRAVARLREQKDR